MSQKNRAALPGKIRPASRAKTVLATLFLLFASAYALAAPQSDTSPFSENLKAPPTFIPEFMAEKENAAALYSDGIYAVYATERVDNGNKSAFASASRITPKNWSLGVEARNSPVLEEHGNPERHESLGGLVKGTCHF